MLPDSLGEHRVSEAAHNAASVSLLQRKSQASDDILPSNSEIIAYQQVLAAEDHLLQTCDFFYHTLYLPSVYLPFALSLLLFICALEHSGLYLFTCSLSFITCMFYFSHATYLLSHVYDISHVNRYHMLTFYHMLLYLLRL